MPELSPFRIVEASFAAAAKQPSEFPPPLGVELAFAGRSNVGKSSLLNSLMGRKGLVRVGSKPGVTRHVAFFKIRTKDGVQATLVDLPGYGYAQRSKAEIISWKALVEAYLFERPCLQAVALLVDCRRGIEAEEEELLQALKSRRTEFREPLFLIVAATKLDKLPRAQQGAALARVRAQAKLPVVGFSTLQPEPAVELWQKLRAGLSLLPQAPGAT